MSSLYILWISLILQLVGHTQTQEIAASKTVTTLKLTKTEQSVVFIAGFDEGDNAYYKNAKDYFKNRNMKIVDHLFSLTEIISYLNQSQNTKKYGEIHIVSHSNPWRGMSLKTSKNGERITIKTLLEAQKAAVFPKLNNSITNRTKIVFHSCGLGTNKELLKILKPILSAEESPKLFASSFFNVFGGKFAGHYLAKPYYGFYPTAESPGPLKLAQEFKSSYPLQKFDWLKALKNRKEQKLGEVYTYKFNIPVAWEFDFEDKQDMPVLENPNQIMDWIAENTDIATVLFEFQIPIEKYRWRNRIIGNKLIIEGKTTVLCVLQPIMDYNDSTEYRLGNLEDEELYQII